MNLTYFTSAIDNDNAKTIFRSLAKQLHPDKGGNEESFKELNSQWQYIQEKGITFPIYAKQEKTTIVDDTPNYVDHKKLINDILHLRNLKGYQKGWVFYTFKTSMEVNQEKITLADLQYLAFKLGYAEGWVYWKSQELKI